MNDNNYTDESMVEPEADHWLMLWVEDKANDFESVEVDDFILID